MERTCKWCGEKFTRRANEQLWKFKRRKYCSKPCSCNRNVAVRWNLKNVGKHRKSGSRNHICKCPTCGKTHSKYMFWTGNGTPRFFCNTCADPPEDRYAYITIHDKERRRKVREMFRKWDEQIEDQHITRYSEQNYSQEELWKLVEECR